MADEILGGRYRIVSHLARGGMAEVYLAHDELLDRPVAVKVMFPELARDPSFVERFRREAQSAARLNHPNIVSVYDFGEEADASFIVMEYVAGSPLNDIIVGSAPMAPSHAIGIAADVAAALGAAHREGIIHRDVKPANVLIADGVAKVADFGIARAVDARGALTMPGVIIGTASYLSPEQARGLAVDNRSDLYSLGLVVYEMLTGRPPFAGDNPVTVAYKQQHEAPRAPSSYNPAVSPQLEGVVSKALSFDPADRQATADDLRAELLAAGDSRVAGKPTATFGLPDATAAPGAPAARAAGAPAAADEAGAAAGGDRAGGFVWAADAASSPGTGAKAAGVAAGVGGEANAPTEMVPVAKVGTGGSPGSGEPANGTPQAVFRRRRIVVAGALILLVVACVVAVVALNRGGSSTSTTVSVPSVVGLPLSDATAMLTTAGLTSQVVNVNLPGPPDHVLQQFPKAGVPVKRGSSVALDVPSATTTTSVPRSTTRPTTRATTTAPTTLAPATAVTPAVTVPTPTTVVVPTTVSFITTPTS